MKVPDHVEMVGPRGVQDLAPHLGAQGHHRVVGLRGGEPTVGGDQPVASQVGEAGHPVVGGMLNAGGRDAGIDLCVQGTAIRQRSHDAGEVHLRHRGGADAGDQSQQQDERSGTGGRQVHGVLQKTRPAP